MSEVHVNTSDPVTRNTVYIQKKRRKNRSLKQGPLLHLIPLTDKNWIEKPEIE